MKTWKLMYVLSVVAITAWLSSCGEDEKDKPKTMAVVETMPVTEFTTTTADVEGEITDNGNLEITESGFVYSNIVSTPTIADSKVEVEAVDGMLSTTLTELESGTLYRVRAYATNSKGTAYGSVEIFTTGNAAPVASALSVTGDIQANKTITANYIYTDAEGDEESGSTFKWYRATSATGTGETQIAGETGKTYLIKAEDEGKFIKFTVMPKAAAGNITGSEVSSTYVGAVGEATTVTFTYMGNSVTYGIINSATTGRKWLDRNIGAPNQPTSETDYANYGDLFQWGRGADGHQLINRTGPLDAEMIPVNGTTTQVSASPNPGNALFILGNAAGFNWINPTNNNLWQGTAGVNNPCPTDWRLPTKAEIEAEGIASIQQGYISLKLTITGLRSAENGSVEGADYLFGYYHTSTIGESSDTDSKLVLIGDGTAFTIETTKVYGAAVRCTKD